MNISFKIIILTSFPYVDYCPVTEPSKYSLREQFNKLYFDCFKKNSSSSLKNTIKWKKSQILCKYIKEIPADPFLYPIPLPRVNQGEQFPEFSCERSCMQRQKDKQK